MSLGTVKDATLQLAATPVVLAGRVVSAVARAGLDVAGRAVDTLAPSQAPGQPPVQHDADRDADREADRDEQDLPVPVNIHDELGLDAAPVEKPRRKPKPLTKIDAQADPAKVDATPADVAKVVSEEPDAG